MDGWQGVRMRRAIEQDIVVTRLDIAVDSFIFHVQGVSGEYMIEIYENATLWPPACDCQNYYWRGDIICKHMLLCLVLMGVDAGLWKILIGSHNKRSCTNCSATLLRALGVPSQQTMG